MWSPATSSKPRPSASPLTVRSRRSTCVQPRLGLRFGPLRTKAEAGRLIWSGWRFPRQLRLLHPGHRAWVTAVRASADWAQLWQCRAKATHRTFRRTVNVSAGTTRIPHSEFEVGSAMVPADELVHRFTGRAGIVVPRLLSCPSAGRDATALGPSDRVVGSSVAGCPFAAGGSAVGGPLACDGGAADGAGALGWAEPVVRTEVEGLVLPSLVSHAAGVGAPSGV